MESAEAGFPPAVDDLKRAGNLQYANGDSEAAYATYVGFAIIVLKTTLLFSLLPLPLIHPCPGHYAYC